MADRVTLPTDSEIGELPRWARVALAARCARRVVPLFAQETKGHHLCNVEAVVGAVRGAEESASGAKPYVSLGFWDPAPNAYESVYDAADTAARLGFWTAQSVACAARDALVTAFGYDSRRDVGDSLSVFTLATAVTDIRAETAGMVVRDYEVALSRSRSKSWTDDTPVSPEVFGPLWPDGPPVGWPTDGTTQPDPRAFIVEAPAGQVSETSGGLTQPSRQQSLKLTTANTDAIRAILQRLLRHASLELDRKPKPPSSN